MNLNGMFDPIVRDWILGGIVGILDDLSMGAGCKAIANTDKTAILAFSENQQSRARELDIGDVLVGTIKRARNSL